MNHNKVIKAIENCLSGECSQCQPGGKNSIFPPKNSNTYCRNYLLELALNSLKTLKAESDNKNIIWTVTLKDEQIERIKADLLKSVEYDIKVIKAEAIKEFAERLKATFPNNSRWVKPREKIDNLVKEMVGEDK